MPHRVRNQVVIVVAATIAMGFAGPSSSASVEQIAWHLTPGEHYETAEKYVHVVSYDVARALRSVLGPRADPTTILEERNITLNVVTSDGKLEKTDIDVRRFGGDHPKESGAVQRIEHSTQTLGYEPHGTPVTKPLNDAGEGVLDALPRQAVRIGESWTFTRPIKVERELGQGAMTYTNTLTRIEERNNHRIAVISVTGSGPVDAAANLQTKGFKTATMSLRGTAEFDLSAGVPGAQHFVAHVQWNARVVMVHIGLLFDDTYDATPWVAEAK